jgi:3'-5' exoribonuclease
LLHDAGKADDFRLRPDRDGYAYSERGQLVGARHTVLEWLAVARGRDGVIVPEGQYLALVHALTATRGVGWLGIREPQMIEATILAVADRASSEALWSPDLSTIRREQLYTGEVR